MKSVHGQKLEMRLTLKYWSSGGCLELLSSYLTWERNSPCGLSVSWPDHPKEEDQL